LPFVVYAGCAVVHLITSDASPEDNWRKILVTRMIDADTGTVEDPSETSVDLLPANLIDRCFGLLRANCDDDKLGLAAVYIKHDEMWSPSTPSCEKESPYCVCNSRSNRRLL
jgi:hypothetical protein